MSDSDDEGGGVPLLEDVTGSASPQPQSHLAAKRKRDDEPKAESKRAAKRKKTKKPKDVDDEALDLELGVNHAIAHMDSRLLADHLAQRMKRFQPELSLVEADDSHVPEVAILDTTSWEQGRTMDKLPDYLEQYAFPRRRRKRSPRLTEAAEAMGSPHTLVVAGAGLRAADLTRVLRQFQSKESTVAKLFAKHIKLKEAIETAKQTRMGMGVGTPQRIIDLLEDGALSAAHLERIIIDASHIDQKKRGLLDMKDTLTPLVQLLSRKALKERYGSGQDKVELLFF